jgi:hypothetical protein
MISQSNDLLRLLVVQSVQLMIATTFLIIAYKILKRNKNQISIVLSCYYIFVSAGLIFAGVRFVFIKYPPIFAILYFFSLFLMFFSMVFLVLFNIYLYNLDSQVSLKKTIILILSYAVIILLILSYPDGYKIGEETNWFPVWSWTFLMIIYISSAIIIILPFTLLFIRVYKTFQDKALKKKLRLYYLGAVILIIGWYGGTLYNTWDYSFYRSIWVIVSFIVAFSTGLIIYFAWGRTL